MSGVVVMLSGGLDSCVAAMLATGQHAEVHAISFRYGSLHEAHETRSARAIADELHLDSHLVVNMPDVFTAGALMGESDMPHQSYDELAAAEGPSPTYVPFRNANMISLATARALVVDADEVWAGAHAEDAHNWAYPDCTPEFNGAMAAAVYIGTYHKVRLVVPFQLWTKTDIVRTGMAIDAAMLARTWSCYDPRGDRPCGECPTCVARAHAFAEAGFADPALEGAV